MVAGVEIPSARLFPLLPLHPDPKAVVAHIGDGALSAETVRGNNASPGIERQVGSSGHEILEEDAVADMHLAHTPVIGAAGVGEKAPFATLDESR